MTQASLDLFQSRNRGVEVNQNVLQLASIARRQGDDVRAASLLADSLRRSQAAGLRPLLAAGLAEAAYHFSALARAGGSQPEAEWAARLLGAGEALCRAMGMPVPPADVAERAEYERAMQSLTGVLGAARLDEALADGAAMGAQRAVDRALAALEVRAA